MTYEEKLLKRAADYYLKPYDTISNIYSQPECLQLKILRTSSQVRHFRDQGVKVRVK